MSYFIQKPQDEYGNTGMPSAMIIKATLEQAEHPANNTLVFELPISCPWTKSGANYWLQVPDAWGEANVTKEYTFGTGSTHDTYCRYLRELGYDYPFLAENEKYANVQ